jgi:hypothetical protein
MMKGERGETGWWSKSVAYLAMAIAFYLLAPAVADPDLWGHIRFGQLTWAAGEVLRVDPFSYLTAGQEWINHEWLAEVVFAGLNSLGGGRALLLFKLALAIGMMGLVYRHLTRAGLDVLRAALVLFPVIVLLIPGLTTVRPQMFTYVFFLLTLLILYGAEAGRPRGLWLLPPLFVLWINFPGGVLAGVGVVGIWAFGRGLEALPELRRAGVAGLRELSVPAAVVGGCLAALLINPYGVGLPAFLIRTGTVPRPDIMEWQTMPLISPRGIVYLAASVIGIAAVVRGDGHRRLPLVLLFFVLALLPLTAIRHLQLFALGFGVLLADRIAAVWARSRDVRSDATNRLRPIMIGSTLFMATALTAMGSTNLNCIRIDPVRSIPFPARAVEWIKESGVTGNMAVYFDWGEYALWHLAPGIRISMDGRRETVYPDSIYSEYLRFQNGLGEWRDVLDKRPTDLVLFAKTRPTVNLMSLEQGWRQAYEDSLSVVFARVDGPHLAALARTPLPELPHDGSGLCVP